MNKTWEDNVLPGIEVKMKEIVQKLLERDMID